MKRIACISFLLVSFLAAGLTAGTRPAEAAEIVFFSLDDTVRDVRQVTARFSESMVALGDPRLPDPFEIDCPAGGEGRWADDRNWVYDFDEDLPAGIACTFTVKPAARTLSGAAITGKQRFSFDTGGPAIRGILPHEGSTSLDSDQIFLISLDAPVNEKSLPGKANCKVNGVLEEIPLELVDADTRRRVLDLRRRFDYTWFRFLWKDGIQTFSRITNEDLRKAEDRVVVARCRRSLPPDTRVEVIWGKGIETASGIATDKEQRFEFRVRPPFLAKVSCERTNAQAACIPVRPITVAFTSPISRELATSITLTDPGGKAYTPDAMGDEPFVQQARFGGPFPPNAALTVTIPEDIVDDADRSLANGERFPLEIETDRLPSLAKFPGTFGILEAKQGGVLPLTLRNIEPRVATRQAGVPVATSALRVADDDAAIADWLRRVRTSQQRSGEWQYDAEAETRTWVETTGNTSVFAPTDNTKTFTIPKPLEAKSLEVIGVPLKDPGFYVVEVSSPELGAALLGKGQTRYVATAALVTDMAVHFKSAPEAPAIWVTSLDTGEPVEGAVIAVTDFCSGELLWHGRTDDDGLARPGRDVGLEGDWDEDCRFDDHAPLMISARTADDVSFTLSTWNQGISPWDFGVRTWEGVGDLIAHTVTDRPLFRAGETVSMKHFLRSHHVDGMRAYPDDISSGKVEITHQGSWETKSFDVTFSKDGTATSEWTIPKNAKLGTYSIALDAHGTHPIYSGSFKVQQFRVPTMKAVVQGPAEPQVNPTSVQLDLFVAYQSGGGASGAPVKLRTAIQDKRVTFPDFDDYTFGGDPVDEQSATREGSRYDIHPWRNDDSGAAETQVMPLTLDSEGTLRTSVPVSVKPGKPVQLVAELEYADANGEVLTTAGRVPLWPAELHVGIRPDGWIQAENNMKFRVLVLDLKGQPVVSQKVDVGLYHRQQFSFRKRLIGGFYDYDTTTTVEKLDVACDGTTDKTGHVFCDVAPNVSGEILVRAETADKAGNPAGATRSIWIAGDEDWWFGGTASDRMDVLAEKKAYEPGDTAKLQVRMPFRRATALVTVEREGVIDAFVTELEGHNPVLEVPIKGDYAPNAYISVLAVRGRTGVFTNLMADWAREFKIAALKPMSDGGTPTGLIDLGKPAYRMGLTDIDVGWQDHRLDVRVKPDADVFKIREKAKVKIKVKTASGKSLPEGAEVAIAAVDKGLLELAPNNSWALLDAMMGRRSLGVQTATAQMQVVGKRHYGKKAVPDGGGGGRDRARELFDTLLLWKGRVALDDDGEATVEVPLNDSLTSFRIVAVAHAGGELFGTGSASIRTTQDLMVHSGAPPLVREGDSFDAAFTLRNTTGREMKVTATAEVAELKQSLPARSLTIPAGESRDAIWRIDVPVDVSALSWTVTAEAGKGTADKIKISQEVIPAVEVRTYSATISQVDPEISLPAALPEGAIPGRGGLQVKLMSSLAGSLDGVRAYMSRYTYTCMEQQVSRAIALRNTGLWDSTMQNLPSFQESNGLLRYFRNEGLPGSDTLTAYVLAIAHEAGWQIPDPERAAMIEGLKAFVAGRIVVDSPLQTADLMIRKLAAIEALSRYGEAEAGMLDSIDIEPNLWPTSAVLDWLGVLDRVTDIKGRDAHIRKAKTVLRSRLNFQGTTMTFSTERNDALWWLMISADSNAVRTLGRLMEDPAWKEDVPRLVRGALGRQLRGHWNTTVANAWGVLAFEKFGRLFEADPVAGLTTSVFGGNEQTATWDPAPKSGSFEHNLPWQEGTTALKVTHDGPGAPWMMVRAEAALPLKEALSTGFKITRTIEPIEQSEKGVWSKGDVVRVTLDLEAQSDMTWVVVDDPVPAGATILGSGLGGQSSLLTRGEQRKGYVWSAFEERRFNAFIAYYRFVPKGKWTVEYTVRLNNPGHFQLPATRVEAMYAPEMFGALPNDPVEVQKAP